MKGKGRKSAKEAFREAITTSAPLRLRDGLQAIKKSEGKGQIGAEDTSKVLGSVAIDDDCREAHSRASRWDYVAGYDRNGRAIAYFIEVHPAETTDVAVVEKKFDWLLEFLAAEGRERLRALPAEFHWVASGRVNIPQHMPQYKKLHTTLRKRGLRFSGKALVLT